MTAIAASKHRHPRERPTLRAKVCEAYLLAAVFALEAWVDCARVAEYHAKDAPSASHGRAVTMRDFWQGESDRCEAIVKALEGMAP